MVPDEFHDFFVASAGVAGALIGLLFVAISVHPEQIGEDGGALVRFRPSSALSALLNPLLLSLLLLIPETDVGSGVVAVGLVGVAAVLALLLGLLAELRAPRRLPVLRSLVLLLGQGAIYVLEVRFGLRLRHGVDPVGPLQGLCGLVLVLFVIGIERAWEFVGARMPGLVTLLLGLGRRDEGGRGSPSRPDERPARDVG